MTRPVSIKPFSVLSALSLPGLIIMLMSCGREMPEKRWERISTDSESINRGEALFNAHCRYCHDPYSTRMKAGPGLMGILRNPMLPFSNRPATPENIREQLIHPVDHMPSFNYLKEEETADLLSFLNTL